MNAVSSYRPFGESAEADKNQVAAHMTWVDVFDSITYFGEPCRQLYGFYKHCIGKPSIKEMAEFASKISGWTAIINADILLKPGFRYLPVKLDAMRADCAYSFRIHVGDAKPKDYGLDVFLARPEIWKCVSEIIPPEFCIGKIQWDTWMISYFVNKGKCVDFTPMKLVYHPVHGERNDQSLTIGKNWFLDNVRMAARKLKG